MIFNQGFLRRFLFGLRLEGMDVMWREMTDLPGADTEVRRRLQLSSGVFVSAYNASLETDLTRYLFSELETYDSSFKGFAYEGAGMGMAMLDYTTLGGRSRLLEFAETAPNYSRLAYIGAGLAIAVLNRNIEKSLAPINPMERWWAIDGYGFYKGVFKSNKCITKQAVPRSIKGYALRAFDRGIGRALWFLFSGDFDGIVSQIKAFPQERHADIWAGIGVASTYAGGVDANALQAFKSASGSHASYMAVGSSLASSVRYYANNIVTHNNLAASVYCDMSAEDAAKLTIQVQESLTIDSQEPVYTPEPVYEAFRESIRSKFSKASVMV